MNIEILVLQLGLHKALENILISPPAMMFTQLGPQEAFINNLSGTYLMFNNHQIIYFWKKGKDLTPKYILGIISNHHQSTKSPWKVSLCLILFLIDS